MPDQQVDDAVKDALERFRRSAERIIEAEQQMRSRSGPIYERSRERSRIMSDAYRTAGSPRRPHGPLIGITSRGKKQYAPLPLDSPEMEEWLAWRGKKARIRQGLGWEQLAPRAPKGSSSEQGSSAGQPLQ